MTLPSDPVALFGPESLRDLAALKRAYARLLRQHGPEADPDGFAIIQAAYESVRAQLAAPPAAVAPAVSSAPPHRDAAAWTRLLRDAPDLDAIREQLASVPSDPDAALIDLVIQVSLRPEQARELLLAEIDRQRAHPFRLARAVLGLCPWLAEEGWAAVVRDPRAQRAHLALALARLDALVHFRAWESGWSHWQEVGASMVAEAHGAPLRWYAALFRARIWRRPLDEMLAARAWMHDVHLRLEPDDVTGLDAWITAALDVRGASADPDLPSPLIGVLRALLGGDGPPHDADALITLHALAESIDRPTLDRLARSHPVLIHAIAAALGRISGRFAQLEGEAAPPSRRSDLTRVVRTIEEELEQRAPRAELQHPVERHFIPIVVPLLALAALGFALGNGFVACLGVGAFLFVLGWVIVGHPERLSQVRRHVPTLSADAQQWADAELLAVLRSHGAWAHEVAAAAEGLPLIGPAADRLMQDPWADLYGLGMQHVHRVTWESQANQGKSA